MGTIEFRNDGQNPRRKNFRIVLLIGIFILGASFVGCGSGLPELRPGIFEKPHETIEHGRIVEKRYRFYNGPSTINYAILEIDGKPLRIPNGHVEFTSYCEVKGIEAVGFTVRDKGEGAAGIYVLQLDGEKRFFVRICDYGFPGRWEGARYSACKTDWDATKRRRIDWKSD